ncbi:hypothetical protein GCM10027060_16170 [Nesterenkonia halophila]|uniref:membrane protein insertion efficiency factor YidD n=1 Tax=Nesterenkonia halophila TaxID=302044 RepID=UPI001290ECA3
MRTGASGSEPDGETAVQVWIRHADYYVPDGATPGRPGPPPTTEELRRQRWGRIRRTPSALLAGLIIAYRTVISPLYGQVCSYYPSCSAYGLEAVSVHGVLRGVPLTVWRILRCNPFGSGGVDHVPPARRIWPQGSAPSIIETNHPPIPPDDDCAPAEHDQ